MRRSLALLIPLTLALALAVTGVTFAGSTAIQGVQDNETTAVETYENATDYLAIDPAAVEATDYVRVGFDVGLDVGIEGRTIQTELVFRSFRERFEAADTEENRTRAYGRAISTIEDRTDELYARLNGLVASHGEGSISTETLLRERAAIGAEAESLHSLVDDDGGALHAVADNAFDYDLTNEHVGRLETLDGRLRALQGPVSMQTVRLAAGERGSQSVYAESSATSYVFALVEGDTYVRESYFSEEYNPALSNQFLDAKDRANLERAFQRVRELFPTTNPAGMEWYQPSAIYELPGSLPAGEVTVYIDGGTTNPFREDLRLNASQLPVSTTNQATNGSLDLRVNRTFSTGPMHVELFDPAANETVSAEVMVNDQRVGETGEDDSLWAVEPRGDVTVEATTAEGEAVTLTFDSGPPTVQGG